MFFNTIPSQTLEKKSQWTYILVLHCQSPDVVVGPGLLRFLENKEKTFTQHLTHNGRNKMWEMLFQFDSFRFCPLTQEILKGPKLKGSSCSSGKYRSHFFCTQKKTRSEFLSERKEAPAPCSHTQACCHRVRKGHSWISWMPTRVTDKQSKAWTNILAHFGF